VIFKKDYGWCLNLKHTVFTQLSFAESNDVISFRLFWFHCNQITRYKCFPYCLDFLCFQKCTCAFLKQHGCYLKPETNCNFHVLNQIMQSDSGHCAHN